MSFSAEYKFVTFRYNIFKCTDQIDKPIVVLDIVDNLDVVPLQHPFPCKKMDNRCNFLGKVIWQDKQMLTAKYSS